MINSANYTKLQETEPVVITSVCFHMNKNADF